VIGDVWPREKSGFVFRLVPRKLSSTARDKETNLVLQRKQGWGLRSSVTIVHVPLGQGETERKKRIRYSSLLLFSFLPLAVVRGLIQRTIHSLNAGVSGKKVTLNASPAVCFAHSPKWSFRWDFRGTQSCPLIPNNLLRSGFLCHSSRTGPFDPATNRKMFLVRLPGKLRFFQFHRP
jgi:hypothetical protein